MVRLRDDLHLIPEYVRGRVDVGAVRLASNESPFAPPDQVIAAIAEAVRGAHRYPSGGADLAEMLAARLGVSADRVVLGAGSIAVCEQLLTMVAEPDGEVVYSWRSFEAYPVMCAVLGLHGRPVPLAGSAHDLAALAGAVTERTRAIIVCAPNNPTGAVVSSHAANAFVQAVPPEVLIVWDEAYAEFVCDEGAADGVRLAARYPNVVAVRTFSKAFGLAGLRLGYATGEASVIDAVRRVQPPFAVSDAAVAAGLACLEPATAAIIDRNVGRIVAERHRVRDALRDLGYAVDDSHGNFLWLALSNPQSWAAQCADQGVLVRGYPDSGVRVTIATPYENDRFLAVAATLPCH